MNRPLRLLSSLAVALALVFTVSFAVVRAQPDPKLEVAIAASAPVEVGTPVALSGESRIRSTAEPDYDLSRVAALAAVINIVDRSYVDPKRVDPRAMVVAALDGVEKAVAEVLVEGDVASGKLQVTVGTARRDFDISSMKTIFDVTVVMRDVLAFVQRHMTSQKNLRDVELAAVNGMLSTLDPHTMLYDTRGSRDLKTTTRGEFGGLGFKISMRDGNLTVMQVFKNTPAQKNGIRAKDVITRIENQSTINMDLQDAVDRLRGPPGTPVAVVVQRTAWPEPRKITLFRETISIDAISQAKLLAGQIGYVRISQFSGNTMRDLTATLQQQRAQAGGSLRGLVLDLRNNPGGLLDQAIQVSDLFLSDGVIVKTVGGDRVEVKEARGERDDLTALPLVLLVNNTSASASEIVAGALKNNNRALVIGRQTFGKGSVQVLNDIPAPGRPGEDLSLKITVAQYLTPGDLSIQEVGIAPDVQLVPGRALKGAVNYFAPPRTMGEADLDRHLTNPTDGKLSAQEAARRAAERAARVEKAPLELRYLLDEKEDAVARAMKADEKREASARAHAEAETEIPPEQLEDEEVEANPDELVEDFQIRFARELLARHPYADRPRLLEAARLLVTERRAEEETRLEQKLAHLGVDWSSGPGQGSPRAVVTVAPPPGKRSLAGETVPWTVTVENRGDASFHRLRAWSVVQKNPFLDRREFVFGQVKPGEKRTWTVPVRLPGGMDTRHDEVVLHFEDDAGRAPPEVTASVDVVESLRPLFAFSTQVDDEQGGNGDGDVQRGEEITLRVDVKNVGSGPSSDKTLVSVQSLGDEKVFIKKGRAVLGVLKPGESRPALLQIEVKKGLKGDVAPLRVTILDEKLEEVGVEKLDLPVRAESPARLPARGSMRVKVPLAQVRAAASADAPVLGLARKGAVLPVDARLGAAVRVEWQKGRRGFLSASDVEPAQGKLSGSIAEVWQHDPPRIALNPDPQKGPVVVDAERLHVEGVASVPSGGPGQVSRLRDLFIFVNDQKVFFKVAPDADTTRLEFAADVPLKPGNNLVTVFAREDEEFRSHRSFVVNRHVAEVAAQGAVR